MVTGADVVIQTLADAGIDLCFSNPGTTEMWLVQSLSHTPNIRSVLALHETVCSGAADGYARMQRKPALCLLHMGPGLSNSLCNLHNAKRARSPIVVLVGDMATWHQSSDAPLCMDIQALAQTVCSTVSMPQSLDEVKKEAERVYWDAVQETGDPLKSRVTCLILPHDFSWTSIPNPIAHTRHIPRSVGELDRRTVEFLDACLRGARGTERGKVAVLIGGRAALEEGDAVVMVGKIAAKIGGVVYCENSFARVDRGLGRPHVKRLPYFPQDAIQELKKYSFIITLDCRLPVAQFGYRNGPSDLISLDDDHLWQIDAGDDTLAVIRYLYTQLQADSIIPARNCLGLFPSERQTMPQIPDRKLTPATLCSIIAQFQPDNAIVVDESITSGSAYWDLSKGCPAFTHLTLTGGAIGSGPAVSIGAAIACPDRTVVNIQADGSAMYCPQAFWTQVKEKLNIVTVICSNRTYAILKIEVAKQGIQQLNGRQLSHSTDLTEPEIDWVKIADGLGMSAVKAETTQEFSSQFQRALHSDRRPFLIEAVL